MELKIFFYRLALKVKLFLRGARMKAVFLDRDGTLNKDFGYASEIKHLELFPETVPGLKKLFSSGYILIIISNQSGVGRGYFTLDKVKKFNARLIKILAKEGIFIAGVYVCPHAPEDGCLCRKPNAGLFEKAIQDFRINTKESYSIGDKEADVAAAEKVNIKGFQLGRVFKNILEAAEFITAQK